MATTESVGGGYQRAPHVPEPEQPAAGTWTRVAVLDATLHTLAWLAAGAYFMVVAVRATNGPPTSDPHGYITVFSGALGIALIVVAAVCALVTLRIRRSSPTALLLSAFGGIVLWGAVFLFAIPRPLPMTVAAATAIAHVAITARAHSELSTPGRR